LLLRAHPGHVFVFDLFIFSAKVTPIAHQPYRYYRTFIPKTQAFLQNIMLTLVLFAKVCLNKAVQKHTRIKAKGGRLPLKR